MGLSLRTLPRNNPPWSLSLQTLWAILGVGYKEIGDIARAFGAFKKAQETDRNNVWLSKTITNLSAPSVGSVSC